MVWTRAQRRAAAEDVCLPDKVVLPTPPRGGKKSISFVTLSDDEEDAVKDGETTLTKQRRVPAPRSPVPRKLQHHLRNNIERVEVKHVAKEETSEDTQSVEGSTDDENAEEEEDDSDVDVAEGVTWDRRRDANGRSSHFRCLLDNCNHVFPVKMALNRHREELHGMRAIPELPRGFISRSGQPHGSTYTRRRREAYHMNKNDVEAKWRAQINNMRRCKRTQLQKEYPCNSNLSREEWVNLRLAEWSRNIRREYPLSAYQPRSAGRKRKNFCTCRDTTGHVQSQNAEVDDDVEEAPEVSCAETFEVVPSPSNSNQEVHSTAKKWFEEDTLDYVDRNIYPNFPHDFPKNL